MTNPVPIPTYADPVEVYTDKKTGQQKGRFSMAWLGFFLGVSDGSFSGVYDHNSLSSLQGGMAGEYYHLSAANFLRLVHTLTAPSAITVGASPFTHHNTQTYAEGVVVQGGTVTKIEFSRDNVTFYDVGVIAGVVELSVGDYLKVTYTVLPNMTEIPR